MADNYIERKMEDMRAGRLAPTPKVARHNKDRRCVLVMEDDAEVLEKKVRECRRKGWLTAFAGKDRAFGYRLAQRTGARYCPVDDPSEIENLKESLKLHWRTLTLEILRDEV